MSKFCTNCGSQSDDNASVCTNCGNPFQNVNAQNQNQMPQATPMPNYGGMPQATPMPNYGAMPQSAPMSGEGSILDKNNTANVATMPNNNIPPQNTMPNAGYMPPQGAMPYDNNNMPPQGAMPYDNNNMPPQGVMPNAGAMQANNGKNKKTLTVVGIVAGAVVVLAIAGAMIGSLGSGYEKVIDQKLKAVEKLDAEKLAETYPNFIYHEDCETFEEVVEDVEDDIIPGVEECIDVLEKEAGKNIKLSYKVEKVTDLSDSKFEKFCAGIEDTHDYDIKGIKAIKKATIAVTAKGDKDKYEFDWEDVYLIKEDGNWYIMNTDFEFASIDDHNSYLHTDYYDLYKMDIDDDEEIEEDDGDLLY